MLFKEVFYYADKEINNISFNFIFNFEGKDSNEIIKEISNKLRNKYPKYNYSIIIDTYFSD